MEGHHPLQLPRKSRESSLKPGHSGLRRSNVEQCLRFVVETMASFLAGLLFYIMPKHKKKKKHGAKGNAQLHYCILCQQPISAAAYHSARLKKRCNRCYNQNTNESVKRKDKKKESMKRKRDYKRKDQAKWDI